MARKNMISVMRPLDLPSDPKNGHVLRDPDDNINVMWTPCKGVTQYLTGMTTRDARLLARRINQLIDAGG